LASLTSLTDEQLLDRLQRDAFAYFEEYVNLDNGLVADTSRPGAPCSIAVIGMALSSYAAAVRRGWMSRDAAAARTLTALRFFSATVQSDDVRATGYKGFYYHFLDIRSGKRVWHCELTLIDTALLLAGIIVAGCYFDGAGDEVEIRTLSDALYRRPDWPWTLKGETPAQGWKPECGFLHYG